MTYEIDSIQSKFLCHQNSFQFLFGPQSSKWRIKLEYAERKNKSDYYQSREFLKNEMLHTLKQSIGLQYIDMNESQYKKLDIDFALPLGIGDKEGRAGFVSVGGTYATGIELIPEKLKLACTI